MAPNYITKKQLNNIAYRTSKNILGKMLSQAFVIVRKEGLELRIASIDKDHRTYKTDDEGRNPLRLNVNVKNSVITSVHIG